MQLLLVDIYVAVKRKEKNQKYFITTCKMSDIYYIQWLKYEHLIIEWNQN